MKSTGLIKDHEMEFPNFLFIINVFLHSCFIILVMIGSTLPILDRITHLLVIEFLFWFFFLLPYFFAMRQINKAKIIIENLEETES